MWTRSVSFVTPAVVPQTAARSWRCVQTAPGLERSVVRSAYSVGVRWRERSALSDDPRLAVHLDVAEAGQGRRACPPFAPAQEGVRPGDQLRDAEGLRDVVVRAVVQEPHLLALLLPDGQHEDRDIRLLPDAADEGPAVQARHVQVRDDEGELLLLHHARARPPRPRPSRPRVRRARARPSRPCGCRLRRPRRECGSCGRQGKLDLEERAASFRARQAHSAAVHLDKAAGDGEAQPRSRNSGSRGEPNEALEHPFPLRRRNPGPLVGDTQEDGPSVGGGGDADLAPRAENTARRSRARARGLPSAARDRPRRGCRIGAGR